VKRFVHGALIGFSALSVIVTLAVLVPSSAGDETGSESPLGRQVFEAQKCNTCHDVSSANIEAKMKSAKMKGPDLTGVGSRLESDWIAKYVRKEVQLEGKDHKKEFNGTDEDLKAMIDWLSEQNEE